MQVLVLADCMLFGERVPIENFEHVFLNNYLAAVVLPPTLRSPWMRELRLPVLEQASVSDVAGSMLSKLKLYTSYFVASKSSLERYMWDFPLTINAWTLRELERNSVDGIPESWFESDMSPGPEYVRVKFTIPLEQLLGNFVPVISDLLEGGDASTRIVFGILM